MRDALVAALVACANNWPSRWRTKRFLTGLSSDELEFIAEYLGSRILGAEPPVPIWAWEDRQHKMILVREFLGRTGIRQTAAPISRWN